jgi:hypothetical protein
VNIERMKIMMKIMNKYYKTYEQFDFDYDSYLKKYGKEMADSMLKASQRGKVKNSLTLNITKEELKDFIVKEGYSSEINETEDEILDRIWNNIQLIKSNDLFYRVVSVKDKEDIDLNNLGRHYTTSIDRIDDMFLNEIGIDEDETFYLITVKLNKDDIDVEGTIKKGLEWSHEDEVLLKSGYDSNKIEVKEIREL